MKSSWGPRPRPSPHTKIPTGFLCLGCPPRLPPGLFVGNHGLGWPSSLHSFAQVPHRREVVTPPSLSSTVGPPADTGAPVPSPCSGAWSGCSPPPHPQAALKAADLGHLASPILVHRRWVTLLEEELFMQVWTVWRVWILWKVWVVWVGVDGCTGPQPSRAAGGGADVLMQCGEGVGRGADSVEAGERLTHPPTYPPTPTHACTPPPTCPPAPSAHPPTHPPSRTRPQGDREKALGMPVSALMDRSRPGVTKSQPGFFQVGSHTQYPNPNDYRTATCCW